jgi:hypothetical protein
MEATVGFDLRSIVSDPSWTADRRALYLLRRDVASMRSVDPMVWERPPGLPRPPQPTGLWPNLSDLLAAARALDQAGAIVVRITAFEEDEESSPSADPVAGQFDLVGFDVADDGLISGLTNCGYKPEEVASRNCQYLWMRNFRQRRLARHRSRWVMWRLLPVPDLRAVPRASHL